MNTTPMERMQPIPTLRWIFLATSLVGCERAPVVHRDIQLKRSMCSFKKFRAWGVVSTLIFAFTGGAAAGAERSPSGDPVLSAKDAAIDQASKTQDSAGSNDSPTDGTVPGAEGVGDSLTVELVGKRSNRSAIGARLRAEVVAPDGSVRSVYRHVNSGGSFGANPLRQTIGLGKDGKVLLEVFWPTTNQTQQLRDVASNQLIRITEGESDFRVQNVRKVSLH